MREEKSRILHNGITKSVITKVKERKVGFLRKCLVNLAASSIDDKHNTSGSSHMDQTWFM